MAIRKTLVASLLLLALSTSPILAAPNRSERDAVSSPSIDIRDIDKLSVRANFVEYATIAADNDDLQRRTIGGVISHGDNLSKRDVRGQCRATCDKNYKNDPHSLAICLQECASITGETRGAELEPDASMVEFASVPDWDNKLEKRDARSQCRASCNKRYKNDPHSLQECLTECASIPGKRGEGLADGLITVTK